MKRAVGAMVAVVFAMASCGGSDEITAPTVDDANAVAVDDANTVGVVNEDPATELVGFCDAFTEMLEETSEDYVGSAEHIGDVERLRAVAPTEVAGDLAVFYDYLLTGAIDASVDPDSTLTSNWPPDVRDAIQRAVDFGFASC